MPSPADSDRVRNARACILAAAHACTAPDLVQLERALHLLESAAAEIRDAETAHRGATPADTAELKKQITLMKRELAALMRVIDGCAAICRGLSVRRGGTSLAYTAQGRELATLRSQTACELHG